MDRGNNVVKVFGTSEPPGLPGVTKRRRSCRARSEGELWCFESVGKDRSEEGTSGMKEASTYHPYPGLQ